LSAILGDDPLVFIFVTVIIFGGASFLMGQALARTWRPARQILPYGALLTLFNRFLVYALFEPGDPTLLEFFFDIAFIVDGIVIFGFAYAAYRMTKAAKMVAQYPWVYERAGPFAWREKRG